MQAVRTAGQKRLTHKVTPLAATLVRYLYGLPFALLWLYALLWANDFVMPALNRTFLLSGLIAGVLQIVATLLLIQLMTLRNFAVGGTYAKSEILLTAVIGFMFFAEDISMIGWCAMISCVAGLIFVTVSGSGKITALWNRSAIYGLGAGLSFALTSLFLRQASLSLNIDKAAFTATITLTYMVTLQTLLSLIAVRLRQPGQVTAVIRHWRPSLFIGITGVAGSIGWFTAMTLELASYVKTFGQIEFLITLLIAIVYFKEIPNRYEWIGMILIVGGGIALLLT